MLKKMMIVMLISSVYFFNANGVLATTTLEEDREQIQQEREAIKSELSVAEISLAKLVQVLEELNKQVANLNQEIEENEEMIHETEEKIKGNQAEIDALELDIELLQDDIEQRFDVLKDRARSYQKNRVDSTSYIKVVLGSESFGDFISRLITISKIAQADSSFIEQLEMRQQELLDVQAKYEDTIRELDAKMQELETIRAEIDEQQEQALRIRDTVKANEEQQKALIAKLLDEEEDLASKEEDIRNRIAEEIRLQEEAKREAARLEAERREAARKAEQEAKAKAEREKASASLPSRGNTSPSSSGSSTSEGEWLTFTATAYTAYCPGCSGITSMGIDLRSNPNAKVIAVDPSVIPLGSRVEVKGYGTFLAADTGGAIIGRKIDIFMPNHSDAVAFGNRRVELRVIN